MFRHERMEAGRIAARLSQAEMAELLGTTQRRVGQWERGQTVPNAWSVVKIAAVLDLEIEDLMLTVEHGPGLEDLRNSAGLSVTQVATAGISLAAYSRLESGQREEEVPSAIVMRLAVIFAVPEREVRLAVEVSRRDSLRVHALCPVSGYPVR